MTETHHINPEITVHHPQPQKNKGKLGGHTVSKKSGFNAKLKKIALRVAAMAYELLSVIACGFAYLTALIPSKKVKGPVDKTPVLLVHGYMSHSAHWVFMKHRLKKADIGPIYTITLGKGNPFKSIESYAEDVKKKVAQIQKETGRKDLKLVGHSMGGLVSSHFATNVATPDTQVTDIITLGSPLQGTKLAKIAPGKCAKQMRYHSPFTQKLAEDIKKAKHIRFHHVQSKADEIVFPHKSAIPADPNPGTKTHVVRHIGHLGVMFSPSIARKTIEWIKASHPINSV